MCVCVCVCVYEMLPAGAKAFSERSALILLLSEEARDGVLPERLSTLPPRDRGRLPRGSGCQEKHGTAVI